MRFLIDFLADFWSGALVFWCVFSLLLCWLVGLLVRCFAGFLVCWLSVGQLFGPTVPGTVAGLARRATGLFFRRRGASRLYGLHIFENSCFDTFLNYAQLSANTVFF